MAAKLSEDAFNLARKAIEQAPNNPLAMRAMLGYYRHKKAIAQADPLVKRALNFLNDDPLLPLVLGLAYLDDKNFEKEGLSMVDKALPANETNNPALYFVAKYRYEHGAKAEAAKYVAKILASSPQNELALALKAEMERPLPPPPPVAAKAAAPAPLTTEQLLRKAQKHRENDRTKEALAIYEKILDENGQNVQALLGIGWCYIDLNYIPTAISSFQQVININRKNAEAYYGLAEAHRAQKHKAEALNNYRLFLQLAPNHPEAPVARQAIQDLQ